MATVSCELAVELAVEWAVTGLRSQDLPRDTQKPLEEKCIGGYSIEGCGASLTFVAGGGSG